MTEVRTHVSRGASSEGSLSHRQNFLVCGNWRRGEEQRRKIFSARRVSELSLDNGHEVVGETSKDDKSNRKWFQFFQLTLYLRCSVVASRVLVILSQPPLRFLRPAAQLPTNWTVHCPTSKGSFSQMQGTGEWISLGSYFCDIIEEYKCREASDKASTNYPI